MSKQRQDSAVTGAIKPRRRATARRWDEEEEEKRRNAQAAAAAKTEAKQQREAEEARWNRRPSAPANAKSAAERQREAEEARWNRRHAKPEDARGGVSKPDDPKGFVSQFGENFKLDKNPFYLVKPDGTSDLTPKQQEEAAAILGNIFDGKSYSDYKVKEAAKALLEQAAAKEQEQEAARWDKVSKTSHEQERDEGEDEKPEGKDEKLEGENEQQDDRPPAERRADELDEKRGLGRQPGEDNEAIASLESDLPMAMQRADEIDEKTPDALLKSLLNPDYVKVVGGDGDFGGNQKEYGIYMKYFGCGVIAMNDVLLYMSRATGKEPDEPVVMNMD